MKNLRRLTLLLACIMLIVGFSCTSSAAEAITITSQPKSVIVPNGSAATVKVAANGSGLSYLWYRKLATETSFTSTGITSSTYSITMSYEASGQHVYCRITDSKGNSVNSGFAALNSSDVSITFTKTLSDRRVKPMASNWLYANATGSIWKYAWYRSGSSGETYYSDRTKESRALVLSKGSVEYTYCVVTSHAGYTVATDIAKITTNEPKIISCSEKTVKVTNGETFTLFVEATGDDLEYLWTSSPVYTKYLPDISERRSPTLTLTMNENLSKIYVYCKITDSHGNEVETHDISLRLPDFKITRQPEGGELVIGMEAKTSIEAIGEDLRYQWYCSYKNGDPYELPCTGPDMTMTPSAAGQYAVYCVVTDKSEQTLKSYKGYFDVYAPVHIKRDIADNKARVGTDIGFNFQAEGCGVTYQWYCKWPGSADFAPLSGETSNACSFTMDSSTNGSQVYCIATDIAGNTVRSSTVSATIDSSISISGNCDKCSGDGNCNKCGGDMWFTGFKWVYGSNGLPESVLVTELCDAVYCVGGSCSRCGGDGWIGEITLAGDADGNGSITTRDALLVLQSAAGWNVTIDVHSSDVNGNNTIEPYDAVLILQNIAGR